MLTKCIINQIILFQNHGIFRVLQGPRKALNRLHEELVEKKRKVEAIERQNQIKSIR